MRFRVTRYAAAGLAALLLAGTPGAAQGALSEAVMVAPAGAIPVRTYGAAPFSPEGAAPTISKEEALALVQRYFKLPEGSGWIEVELYEHGPNPVWQLIYWQKHDSGSHGTGIGEVDAVTGRVLGINLLDRFMEVKKGPLGEPRPEEEARSRAWELIQTLYPDKADSLMPYDGSGLARFYRQWDTYTFVWVEHHNGIPISPNTVMVAMDRYTLDYVYFQASFDDSLVIPDAVAAISAEDALSMFQQAARPLLWYTTVYPSYMSPLAAEPEVKLLYEVEVPDMLDAVTGEFVDRFGKAPLQGEPQEIPAGAAPLKPASLPLTAESGEAFSRQILELPADSDMVLDRSSLDDSADYSFVHLYWTGSKGYASVALDRETGRVRSAYRYFNDSDDLEEVPEPTPEEREVAAKEAIRVVQQLYADLLPDLKLDSLGGGPSYYRGPLTFHFQRYVNGIPYDSDGVWVSVNYRTGKWTDISWSWTDEVEVPSPEGVISPEEAQQAHFRDRTAQLVYYPKSTAELFAPSEQPQELVLVYRVSDPFKAAGFFGIDAFTGEPVTMGTGDADVMDSQLSGHWAEGELRFLLSRGLIDASTLNPDRPVTRAEALSILIGLHRLYQGFWSGRELAIPYIDVPKGSGLAEVVRQALQTGILRPEGPAPVFGADEEISRTEFALWLVRALEFGSLAESNLKTVPGFTDADGLNSTERNAAAFLEALDIIPAGGEFRGAEPLTLAEAAAALVRLIELLPVR